MLLMKKIAVSRATPTQTTRASSSARPRSSAGAALALVQRCVLTKCGFVTKHRVPSCPPFTRSSSEYPVSDSSFATSAFGPHDGELNVLRLNGVRPEQGQGRAGKPHDHRYGARYQQRLQDHGAITSSLPADLWTLALIL